MSVPPSPTSATTPAIPVWIAVDPASITLLEQARKVAVTRSTVLIRGESGTGKDLLAACIHYLGAELRAREHSGAAELQDPLLTVDCASLPEELMESELFGYEPGAFTGATQTKRGRLEMAAEGTVVFDEVAALNPSMQAKLLRVIEDKKFYRLGSSIARPLPLQARVIALTNHDLAQAVKRGEFRDDLYHRLNVIPLEVPPLRARRSDIPPLAGHLLGQLRGSRDIRLTPEAVKALEVYSLPGNVRELRNILERAMFQTDGKVIGPEHLPAAVQSSAPSKPQSLAELERAHIEFVLDFCRGKKSKAAEILGITRKTLLDKRKKYGLG